nr:TSUP family transporter [Ktedonobacter sp. SOSP1-85]
MIRHLRSFFSAHQVSGGDQQGSDPSEHQQEPVPYPYAWATALIGGVLQGGVLISAAVMLVGIILLPTRPGGLSPERLLVFPFTGFALVASLAQWHPQGIITLGLLLLIATPVLRVAVSIVMFAVERDHTYVFITCLVLAILLFSIFGVGTWSSGQHAALTGGIQFSALAPVLIFLASIAAGLLGSLVGLGGGVLIVPLLILIFKLPVTFAIGASIISVIATSSGAAAAYVRDRLTNLRIGMFLEIATTIGAISGAFLAGVLAPNLLNIIFGVILLLSAAPLVVEIGEDTPQGVKNDHLATWLHLSSIYPDHKLGKDMAYQVTRTPWGLAMMYVAGLISGLLGIGSGTFKVIALDSLMRLPIKVSTTTSNFMIGVTAAASAGIYFSRGDIPPLIAAPVALGILVGALVGARLLASISNKLLRLIFLLVLLVSAIEMILHGVGWGAF